MEKTIIYRDLGIIGYQEAGITRKNFYRK